MLQAYSASMLRRELSERGKRLARSEGLLHELSPGGSPVVMFGRDETGRHGNFHAASYERICATPEWSRRLLKVHTASRRVRALADWRWMELDSVNSSDALLMNVFCHPGVVSEDGLSADVARLLGVDGGSQPCFGLHPGVPLKSGRVDRTEIDMQLADLYVEAKLTETGFQQCGPKLLERYRDYEAVFDVSRLPWTPVGMVQGYQLIRNVLAAYAGEAAFCVLCDARRKDLVEMWYSVMAAVQVPGFRWRLKLLTWQELAGSLPGDLQEFLEVKYGIVAG
ncbi:MAG: hypothetical protein JWM43_2299 [Acidobacteriaceae bacterium]|nr:hypothetical protein [Acidobacteriaceae bacterium]